MKNVLGEITREICDQWDIPELLGKKIVFYPDRKEHCKERHFENYSSDFDYYYTMDSLEDIIKEPDYVFYNKETNGLEYFKKINENILVAVRVSPGSELKVRSVYPVSDTKIENRKKKEEHDKLLQKYTYKGEFNNQV